MPTNRSNFGSITIGIMLICALFVYVTVKKPFGPNPASVPQMEAGELLFEYGPKLPAAADAINHDDFQKVLVDLQKSTDAADAKFKFKVIEVRGIAHDTGIDSEKCPFVGLRDKKDPNPAFVVMCCFPKGSKGPDVKVGDLIAVRGVCMGAVGGPILIDCAVVPTSRR